MQLETLTKEVKKLFQSKKPNNSLNRRNEIMNLNRRLEEFDIQFSNLVDQSSSEAAQTLLEISRSLAQKEELMNLLNLERKLPVQQLLVSHVGITRKILDDHYQFIISMALILSGPYPFLRDYFQYTL